MEFHVSLSLLPALSMDLMSGATVAILACFGKLGFNTITNAQKLVE